MYKEIGVLIPALETNRYSSHGDLVKFGGSTLLEWKIIQLLKIVEKGNIYISTDSEKVISVVKEYGVNIINRKAVNDIQDMMRQSIESVGQQHILWANPTSPFIGPKHYDAIIKKYLSLEVSKYDCIISVIKMQEYIIYEDKPLNFNINISETRANIRPVYKITNGCSIAKKEVCLRYRKDFGINPYFYGVDKFVAMEISDIDDFAMLNDLVAHYFRKEKDLNGKNIWQE